MILTLSASRIESVKLLDVDTNAIKFVQSNQLYHVNLIAASVHSQILHCCLENVSYQVHQITLSYLPQSALKIVKIARSLQSVKPHCNNFEILLRLFLKVHSRKYSHAMQPTKRIKGCFCSLL